MEGEYLEFKESGFSVFTRLGLTIRQAQVYLANAQLNPSTAAAIAKNVQADRAEIYRALIKLEKLGLIQRYITNPVTFKALPIDEAFEILLQKDAEKHREIEKQANRFLQSYNKNHNREKPSQEDPQLNLTTGQKVLSRQYVSHLKKTNTSLDFMMNWEFTLQWLSKHFDDVLRTIKRGVKMRCISLIPEGTKMPKNILHLMETGFFEIKIVSVPKAAGIDIWDKKTVFFLFPATLNEFKVLRITDPGVIELAQDHFNLKWQLATTPRWRKNTTNEKQASPSAKETAS
jgi:sugar-specific transcriptional regulator TrmB